MPEQAKGREQREPNDEIGDDDDDRRPPHLLSRKYLLGAVIPRCTLSLTQPHPDPPSGSSLTVTKMRNNLRET